MEVMIPSTTPAEFNFHSSTSSCTTTPTYISAPSSPHRFNNNTFFFSAPTSPTQASAFYKEFNNNNNRHVSAVPFNWEVKPGIPKSLLSNQQDSEEEEDSRDFAFDFSGHLDTSSCSLTTADELFDDGKIKPLKPPPRLQFYDLQQQQQRKSDYNYYYTTPPKSPKKIIKDALSVSPRRRKKKKNDFFDPFVAAHDQITSRESRRKTPNSNSNSKHKKSRSLSPFRRASDLLFDDSISNQDIISKNNPKRSNSSSLNWYKKWKLKDLLLFRSASEGRATTTNKEHMKKYSVLPKKKNQLQDDDVKNSSFRSTDSVGSAGSSRRRGVAVSAHELHYKASRAISEEMRKKTYLPYKQSLLGCLGFTNYSGMPVIHHELSKGLASLNRGYGCGRGSD